VLKITDFGLARLRARPGVMQPGAIAGTVLYMAPETIVGREADARADIFSFGVVLFEMATASLPFQGGDTRAVLHDIVHAPPPSLLRLRPDLPKAFERIVWRAMAKAPEQRYRSMEELAGDLRSLGPAEGPSIAPPAVRPSEVTTALMDTAPQVRRPAPVQSRKAWGIVAVLGLLCLLLVLAIRGWFPATLWAEKIPEEKQLAVLRFTNVGGDAPNEAFCDGLMEALTARLSQLERFQGALRVVPATEIRKEAIDSVREARRAFGVTLALTGSVQRSGEKVRLTVNLVDAKSLRQLRSHTIDTPVRDITALQDGVTNRVAGMLELEMRPDAFELLQAGGTRRPAAYDVYLQGLGYLSRYDKPENVDSAISLFQQAIREDPGYALAHAGLGEACFRNFQLTKNPFWIEEARNSCTRAVELNSRLPSLYVTRSLIHTGTGQYEEGIRDLERALALDPVNAAAYNSLGLAYQRMNRGQDAERTFRKAIELRPGDWSPHKELGVFYSRQGRFREAAECFHKVTDLTPDSYWAFRNLGAAYYYLERYEDARAATEKSLAIRPSGRAWSNLGTIHFFQGRYPEAARAFEKAVELESGDQKLWGNLGDALLRAPDRAGHAADAYRRAIQLTERDLDVNPSDGDARASLALYRARLSETREALVQMEQARRQAGADVNVLFKSGLVYELAGKRDLALRSLAAAVRSGYSLGEINRHPDLERLRRDPRFAALFPASGKKAQR
jgi:eukaryotic-like serine/threonine-protein kinase